MAKLTTGDGVEMAYELSGSGPALLLIHGITESHRMWDPLIPPLAADHTVLAVDLPGHGQSSPPPSYHVETLAAAVAQTTEALDISGPLVIGHSLGGVVATVYGGIAACRGVINVDQPLALSDFKQALAQLEPALRGDEATFQAAIALVFEGLTGALPESERDRVVGLRTIRQDLVLPIWQPVLESSADDLDALVRSFAERVKVPYLALFGGDPGPSYAGWLTGLIDGAVVEVWPDLGHYPHLVEPQRFVERVRSFEASLG